MIFFRTSDIVPNRFRTVYFRLRLTLIATFLAVGAFLVSGTLFPENEFSYSFRDGGSGTLERPTGPDGNTLSDARITPESMFRTYAATAGPAKSVRIRIGLDPSSDIPPKGDLRLLIRKSYRAFFYPKTEPLTEEPKEHGVVIGGVPYLFSEERLYPFFSERAALSRFPEEKMIAANTELLTLFPPQETKAGFRTGAILSDGAEAYIVGSDGKRHRIRNISVFEALGFSFGSVFHVSEDDLSSLEAGSEISLDAAQPEGTLFHEKDSDSFFLVREGRLVPIENDDYRDTLLRVTEPVEIPTDPFTVSTSCEPGRISLSGDVPTYGCDISLDSFSGLAGGTYEISLSSKSGIVLDSISAIFRSAPDRKNLDRFLSRFGEAVRERYRDPSE
jgi:hypothetical protein